MSFSSLKSAFLPVMNGEYWYFTAYFVMYMFIPILNSVLEKFNKKQVGVMLTIGFVLFSLFPTILMNDPFMLGAGYSCWWLTYLYLLGGYINKYNIFNNSSVFNYLVYYICSVLFTFLSKINFEFLTMKIFGEVRYGMMFINYVSPTILFCAICLVIGFSKMKFNNFFAKLISFFAPLSFSVYLIHNNRLLLNKFWVNSFVYLTEYSVFKMIGSIFIIAFGVYLICSLIDYIRFLLFKLFKVKEAILKLENKYFKDLLN